MSSEPLTTLIAAGPMPVIDAVRVIRRTAGALGGVHGELWPSAIDVSRDGVTIAPPGGGDRLRWGQYAAPERIFGKPATPASDVFSLGAMLFHAIAGHPPFRGETPNEVMLAACSDLPLDLRESRNDVPIEVAAAVYRCLTREPAERYATPTELAHALDAALSVLTARPVHFPDKRVLMADDDAPIRDFYAQLAAQVGVVADIVATGRDVVAAMKTCRYDLVLIDLNMPRLSGWEVLDYLRGLPRQDRPRALFIVTGFSDQVVSVADRDIVHAVLYKPVAAQEMRSLVTECLSGRRFDVDAILRTTGHRRSALA
jgi:CheY-like chemotaxis protein